MDNKSQIFNTEPIFKKKNKFLLNKRDNNCLGRKEKFRFNVKRLRAINMEFMHQKRELE